MTFFAAAAAGVSETVSEGFARARAARQGPVLANPANFCASKT